MTREEHKARHVELHKRSRKSRAGVKRASNSHTYVGDVPLIERLSPSARVF
jgi:hypothetical protein